jgi:enamine deaminase RidA (YjgF/YER057c/UK114 family)
VVFNGLAKWVEVPSSADATPAIQIEQVLSQMDQTLRRIGSDRTQVIQVIIYLSDLSDVQALNRQWDVWFPQGHAPVRACVQANLQSGYKIEVVVEAVANINGE